MGETELAKEWRENARKALASAIEDGSERDVAWLAKNFDNGLEHFGTKASPSSSVALRLALAVTSGNRERLAEILFESMSGERSAWIARVLWVAGLEALDPVLMRKGFAFCGENFNSSLQDALARLTEAMEGEAKPTRVLSECMGVCESVFGLNRWRDELAHFVESRMAAGTDETEEAALFSMKAASEERVLKETTAVRKSGARNRI